MKSQNFQLEIKHPMVEVSEVNTLVLVWLIPNFKKLKKEARKIGRKLQGFFLSSELCSA